MSDELVKKVINFTQKRGEAVMKTTVEADIIVPDTKPDIGKILQVDASPVLTGSEMQSDRVLAYGSVDFKIMYLSDGEIPEVKSITATSTFTDVGDIKGVTPQMFDNTAADIESVEFKLLNGRKLAVKAVVETKSVVYEEVGEEVVSEVSGAVQSVTGEIGGVKLMPVYNKSFSVAERITIPSSHQSAGEVLGVSSKISDKSVKVINNKVIVKGEIVITTLYTGAGDGEITSMSNVAQFTEILDVDGITEDNVSEVWLEITKTEYALEENEEGDIRTVNAQTDVLCKVSRFETENEVYIKDFYALDQNVEHITKEKKIVSFAGRCSRQIPLRDKVFTGEGMPEIDRVYDISAKAYLDEIQQNGDCVTVRGHVDAYVLYISADSTSPLYSVGKEIPFSEEFETDAADERIIPDINVQATGASYAVGAGSSAEIRCNVEFGGIFVKESVCNFIYDAKFTPISEDVQIPSITVYFVQNGDTLWDIAKRYYTTTELIMGMNDMKDEKITEGQQLYIPKNKM
jgi:hypothetical protein